MGCGVGEGEGAGEGFIVGQAGGLWARVVEAKPKTTAMTKLNMTMQRTRVAAERIESPFMALSYRIPRSSIADIVIALLHGGCRMQDAVAKIRNSEPAVGSGVWPTAGKEGWVEAGHRSPARDGASRRPEAVSNSEFGISTHHPG